MLWIINFLVFFLVGSWLSVSDANATPGLVKSCIKAEEREYGSDGINITDAKNLIRNISISIGLNSVNIEVIKCSFIDNAEAFYSDGTEVPVGEYIVYNPVWLKSVAGNDPTQVYAILGHELGHLLGRHSFKPHLSQYDRELEADFFAGCAVGNMGGRWDSLESILFRLRPQRPGDYPSASESIEEARKSFEACTAVSSPAALEFLSVRVDTTRSTFLMSTNNISIHAERESVDKISIEFDRDMLAVFDQASCRGIRGDEPIRDALPVWRNLLEKRGRSDLVAQLVDIEDYQHLLKSEEDAIEEAWPTAAEMEKLFVDEYPSYKIMMRWLVECVGISDPVLIWTLKNNSDEQLILSSVDYHVLDIGKVKGSGPEAIEPIDIDPHDLEWKIGVQSRIFSPQVIIPPNQVVSIRVKYLFDKRDWGLTWLVKPVFHTLEGASVEGPELKFFAAKGKPLPF